MVLTARQIKVGSILFKVTETPALAKRILLIKPGNRGTPTIDKAPTVKVIPAMTLRYPAPVKSRNFLLFPDTSVSPTAEINNMLFDAAWEKIWKMEAIIPASVLRPKPI